MVFLKLQLNKLLNELLFIVHFLYNEIHPYEADFHCIKPRGTIVWTSRFDGDMWVAFLIMVNTSRTMSVMLLPLHPAYLTH